MYKNLIAIEIKLTINNASRKLISSQQFRFLCKIYLESYSIPFDTESPMITSGVRLGTPASTTRGFGQKEFILVGQLISKVLLVSNRPKNQQIFVRSQAKKVV